jgi:hypothetical protein
MKKLFTLLMISLTFVLNSCNKDDDEPSDCGCNSETLEEIIVADEDNLNATISYLGSDPLYPYYNDHFWIGLSYPDCVNCLDVMIVCNEGFLNGEFDYLKNDSHEQAQIVFTGKIKKICNRPSSVADYSYYRIVLTSIEKL